jgi:hypothetical protein
LENYGYEKDNNMPLTYIQKPVVEINEDEHQAIKSPSQKAATKRLLWVSEWEEEEEAPCKKRPLIKPNEAPQNPG